MSFERRLNGGMGKKHAYIWGKTTQGGDGKKGLWRSLACSKERKEDSLARKDEPEETGKR